MSNDSLRKLRLGLFVLTGLILLGGALFFFGLSDLFVNKAKMTTFFTESVQGLSAGSPVKYRGVPIGSVSDIRIRASDQVVEVNMDIELNSFVDLPRYGGYNRAAFARFFEEEMRKGLRCRLELTGITGLRYIDFDYLVPRDPRLPDPPVALSSKETVYIQSMPSSLRDIMRGMVTSLDRISKINFEEISKELESSLTSINALLADSSIKATLNRINEAAEQLEQGSRNFTNTFTPQRLEAMANSFQKDLDTLHALMEELRKNTQAARIPESSTAFREAANAAVSAQGDLQDTLNRLNRTLDAMTRLLNTLNDDPASVVHGRRK